MNDAEIIELITRRHRQLLVHSFLYYKMNESIIPDATFDAWCKELVVLHEKYRSIAEKATYYEICKDFDSSGSGYFIRGYPEGIMITAIRLLYHHNNKRTPIEELFSRVGLRILTGNEEKKPKKKTRRKNK
ncbi:DNA ligase LigA-related protein [Fredinandcohnia humi]